MASKEGTIEIVLQHIGQSQSTDKVQDLDTLTDWTLAEMKYELLHR